MDRVSMSADELEAVGQTVIRFEYVPGPKPGPEEDEESYIILELRNGQTIYASAPSFYRDLTASERVPA